MPDGPNDLTFSQRMGLTPVRKAIQVDSMDDDLRNSLWNVLTVSLWNYYKRPEKGSSRGVVANLWAGHLKHTLDSLPSDTMGVIGSYRAYFFSSPWNEVYEFIEFVAN